MVYSRRNSDAWIEETPRLGEQVFSHWEQITGARLINPWRGWLRFTGGYTIDIVGADPVALGFVQSAPGGELVRDTELEAYRQKFGWTDEAELSGPMCQYGDFLRDTARDVINYFRQHTFSSFISGPLGISVEFAAKLWKPEDNLDTLNHDVVPHQDWVRQDVPVAIALGSKTYDSLDCDKSTPQLNTNLWDGEYVYKGDLQNEEGCTINYIDAVSGMQNKTAASMGEIWVADARRGLHGRPTMQPEDREVVRLFMRAFVSPVR